MVEKAPSSDLEEEQTDVDPEELTYLLLKLISPKLKLMNSGTLPQRLQHQLSLFQQAKQTVT